MPAVNLTPVRRFAKTALGSFVEEQMQRFPDAPEVRAFLELAKAHLAIMHGQCEQFLKVAQQETEAELLASMCETLRLSPLRYTQRLFCTLQLITSFKEYLRKPEDREFMLFLITKGACGMYGQSHELFFSLRNAERELQERQPPQSSYERSLRFALFALINLDAELHCGQPDAAVAEATIDLMDNLLGAAVNGLDGPELMLLGHSLIQNNWTAH